MNGINGINTHINNRINDLETYMYTMIFPGITEINGMLRGNRILLETLNDSARNNAISLQNITTTLDNHSNILIGMAGTLDRIANMLSEIKDRL